MEPIPSTTPCREHRNHPLELYCVTCDTGICCICLTTSHRRHSIDSLRDVQAKSVAQLQSVAGTFRALADASAENSRMLQSVRGFEADLLGQIGRLVMNAQEYVASVHRKIEQQEAGWGTYLEQQAAGMLPEGSKEGRIGPPPRVPPPAVMAKEEQEEKQPVPMEEKPSPIVPYIEMRQCIVNLNSSAEDLCNVVLNYEYGISWNLQFTPRRREEDCELSISCRTSEDCPEFVGNFLLQMDVVRLEDLSVFSIRKSLQGLTMRRFFVIPAPILIDTTELEAKGFLSRTGRMTVRVGIGPEDAPTERTCLLINQKILQQRNDILQNQLKHCSFTIGSLTIADYHAESEGQFHSKPIVLPNGSRWTLRLKLNLGAHNAKRTHLSVQIVKLELNTVRHEFFVELLHGTREGFSYRMAGTNLVNDIVEPLFITKERLKEYLVNGNRLEMRFGVREWFEE